MKGKVSRQQAGEGFGEYRSEREARRVRSGLRNHFLKEATRLGYDVSTPEKQAALFAALLPDAKPEDWETEQGMTAQRLRRATDALAQDNA